MKGKRTKCWQSYRRYFLCLLLPFLCLTGAGSTHAADTFDGSYLRIPLVVVNGATFSNVVVTLGSVVGVAGGVPAASYDSYDGATGYLSIPSVQVGSTVYTNVVITLGGVTGVGGSSTASPVITSIDNSAPTPLTVLHIATTGLIPNTSAFVSFSDGAKYSVTLPAVRVAADGTVAVGTPFYLNGTSGAIGPGTVTVTVSQGANRSKPMTISIQDLPALSTYGTSPGVITKSFLAFEANLHAARLNELQAVQPLLGGSTDTSAAQTTLATMLGATVTSGNSVNSIVQNAAYVEAMTVLPDGTSLQLDQNQLMLMDRIIGAYLTEQFSAGVTSGSLVIKAARRPSVLKSGAVAVTKTTASTLVSTLTTFLTSINGSLTARSWALGQTDGSDAGLAAADATASLSGLDENQWVGGFLSLAHINAALESMFHAVSAGAVCMGTTSCTDTSAIQAELNGGARDFVSTYVQAIAATSAATRFAGALVNLADQTATAYDNMQKLYSNGSFKAASATDDTLAGNAYLLGSASGSITQPSASAAPQSYLSFCCFGSSAAGVAGLVDPNGNYSLLMPQGVAGTNYAAIGMNVVDIASGATLDTQTVDLSGLNSQTPVQIPAASYCSNGATDYPTCTPPTCANGATDYPTCTAFSNACNYCSFSMTDYYWRCYNSTYSASGVCLGSTSTSLVSAGTCVTDLSIYTICQ